MHTNKMKTDAEARQAIGPIFTIGHSNHSLAQFVDLLRLHQVNAIADVRSQPYSRLYPQFNMDVLKQSLELSGIAYVFLGRELGARSNERSCYRDGRIQYSLLAQTESFNRGLSRIREGALKYRLALMCAEKEPLDCHRAILIARQLDESGIDVLHIHAGGEIESHQDAKDRLIRQLSLPDMFLSYAELVSEAYKIQEERVAYVLPTEDEISDPLWGRVTG